jgi:hypothetical protein
MLSRTAHFEFVVKTEVFFRDWTELQPVSINYLLKIQKGGRIHQVMFDGAVNSVDIQEKDVVEKRAICQL